MRNDSKFDFTTFYDNVRKIRIARGFSAKDLAVKCKLKHQKRISDFEDDRGVPSLDEIISICKTLGFSMDEMLNKKVKVTISFDEPQKK